MTIDEEIAAIEASVVEGLITKEEGEQLIANLGPRFINEQLEPMSIAGYFIAGDATGPMLVRMDGTNDLFLPIFSTLERLTDFAKNYGIEVTHTKQVDEVESFVDGMRNEGVRIIANPYKHENGCMRYTELKEFVGAL